MDWRENEEIQSNNKYKFMHLQYIRRMLGSLNCLFWRHKFFCFYPSDSNQTFEVRFKIKNATFSQEIVNLALICTTLAYIV
jgi:hypothetical protein